MSDYDRNAAARWGAGVAVRQTAEIDQGLRAYMLGIYNHMSLGVAISGFVALGIFLLSQSAPGVAQALYASPLKWALMLAPLAFVFFFSFKAESMSPSTAATMFYAFSAVMGLSLGSIFFVYQIGSIVQTFFVTAAAFGALSLYGYTAKRSLSAMGSFLVMGLIGLLLASVVQIFVASSALQFLINVAGVLIFAGLTAWDTQRLKEEYDYVAGDATAAAKSSIFGALSLYLNFINMFQFLLSLLGQREE
jgi:FtsH-binding integral membrane protein